MCGIIAVASKYDVLKKLICGLHNLEYRGYDSSGISVICSKGILSTIKSVGKVSSLEKNFMINQLNLMEILA